MTDDTNPDLWKRRAACDVRVHGDLWYAPSEETHAEKKARVQKARTICGSCPVRLECATASANERHGIWAGINVGKPADVGDARDRKPHTAEARALIATASRETAARKFAEFAEYLTTMYRADHTLEEILDDLSISKAKLRQRLNRNNRLDLYAMLTGAAT